MNPSELHRITRSPDICHGKPTVRGLRYPVEFLLDLMASGMSHEDILADYEDLEEKDLRACLEYAVKLAQTKKTQPLAS